jgi:hypothetical protein
MIDISAMSRAERRAATKARLEARAKARRDFADALLVTGRAPPRPGRAPKPGGKAALARERAVEEARARLMADDEPRPVKVTISITRTKLSTRRPGGPAQLSPRMVKLVGLMTGRAPGFPQPVEPLEAAVLVGYRKRALRSLAASPLFVNAFRAAKEGRPDVPPTFESLIRQIELRERDRVARDAARQPRPYAEGPSS